MKNTLHIKKIFTESWNDYKANWKLFLIIGLLFILLNIIGNIGAQVTQGGFAQSSLVNILFLALQVFLTLGYIKFVLNIIDKKEAKIEQLFQGARNTQHYISFLVVGLLVSSFLGIIMIPVVASFFLAVFSPILSWVIGIIFSVILVMVIVGLMFARYLAAEEKMGIFESLKESWKKTRSYQWSILWLIIVVGLFNILGFMAFVIGLAITIPMTSIIYLRAYRQIFDCDCVQGQDDCICVSDQTDCDCSTGENDCVCEPEIIVEEILDGDKTDEEKKDADTKKAHTKDIQNKKHQ